VLRYRPPAYLSAGYDALRPWHRWRGHRAKAGPDAGNVRKIACATALLHERMWRAGRRPRAARHEPLGLCASRRAIPLTPRTLKCVAARRARVHAKPGNRSGRCELRRSRGTAATVNQVGSPPRLGFVSIHKPPALLSARSSQWRHLQMSSRGDLHSPAGISVWAWFRRSKAELAGR
jgi:hypothetical protein